MMTETTETTGPILPEHPALLLPRGVYRQLRRMNKNEINQYLFDVWKSGYELGFKDGIKKAQDTEQQVRKDLQRAEEASRRADAFTADAASDTARAADV